MQNRLEFQREEAAEADSNTHMYMFLHIVLWSYIFILLRMLRLKYIGKIHSPFETHYATLVAVVVTISIYAATSLLAETVLKGRRRRPPQSYKLASNVSLTIGALVPVLLMLILFPPLGWFTFVIWALLFVKVAYDYLHHLLQ